MVGFGRALVVLDAELVGEFLGFFSGHLAFVFGQVDFVANQDSGSSFGSVLVDGLHPAADTLERFFVGHIEGNHYSICASVE